MDRGLKWDEAYARSLELTGVHDGFYLSYKVRGARGTLGRGGDGGGAGMVEGRGRGGAETEEGCGERGRCRGRAGRGGARLGDPAWPHAPPAQVRGNKPSCLLAEQNRGKLFTVYKPNIGRQSQLETLESLRRRFHRVGADPRDAGPAGPCLLHGVLPLFKLPPRPLPGGASAAPWPALRAAARCRMSGPGALRASVSPIVQWEAWPGLPSWWLRWPCVPR